MRRPPLSLRYAALISLLACISGESVWADGTEFFEQKIRPILVERCYKCHSREAEKLKGGLLLDSRAGVLKGGDNGPVIVPGDPDRSRLIKAVRYTDPDLQMPPKGQKLSDQQIADLEAWVKMGAPDPREDKPATVTKLETARKHWAFQPITKPSVPATRDRGWVKTPIDNFILDKLEANGLSPAPPADKRTLLRRASFDLTGLPPTFEEVEAFVKDKSPDAFPKVLDKLLASPRYGERWGRYWLDVARYADTKGYVYEDREDKRFVHSYAYRDWVIKVLNDDMPYDRFLKLQIAADQMADAGRDDLAAMGFLTLGRRFLGVMHDIIDDRIDVLTRGTLGLTVSCARCHDHKFDPIPTADYYSLYGVFAGSMERTVALNDSSPSGKAYLEYEAELKRREDAYRNAFEDRRDAQSKRFRARVTDYLVQVLDIKDVPTEEFYTDVSAEDLNPRVIRRWHSYLMDTSKGFNAIWSPWHAYARIPAGEFAAQAGSVIQSFTNKNEKLNPLVASAFKEKAPQSMREVAETYGKLLADVDKKWQQASDKKNALNKNEAALRDIQYAPDSPSVVPAAALVDMEWYFDEKARVELNKLSRQIEQWMIQSPGSPSHAVILTDRTELRNPHVFRRGNPANVGEEVPRQFLEILTGPDRKPFAHGSGRLDLAEAIASKSNPLTARVIVNRVWQHHFGAGLVRTPSDFGVRSDPPPHPELLDWLANEFIDSGWSLKKLHHLIMSSAVYQQSSEPTVAAQKANQQDPENKLLSHFSRQRLDFEALHDSLLFTSGELELKTGGRAQELFAPTFSKRRAIYGYVDRVFLPGTLRSFDFANPDMHSPQRSETTVPQQALFFMNGKFAIDRAKALAAIPTVATVKSPEEKITRLYRLIYEREPTRSQVELGLQFIHSADSPPAADVEVRPAFTNWLYGFGEFVESKGLKSFQALPFFSGEAWQGGTAWPDKKLGWAQLTATGGHAGDDLRHAVVRRWVSPVSGAISIEGQVKHEQEPGHGVRAYIFSSRHGILGNWVLHNNSADAKADNVAVEPGDTIDFIVSINESLNSNEFVWSPVIRMVGPNAIKDANGYAREWDARREFSGPPAEMDPPLTPWEKYAQALLSANEFLFVD